MNMVTIRDRQYPLGNASVLTLSPLLSAMGASPDQSDKIAAMGKDEAQSYGEQALKRLSEPFRHYQIAFSLSRLFPDIPDEILKYEVYSIGDRRYEDFTLELELDELALLINTAIAGYQPPSKTGASTSPTESDAPATSTIDINPPAAITPETTPTAPVLTAEDVAVLEDLTEDAIAEIRKQDGYLSVLKAIGVSEALFNYIKAS